MWLEQLVIKKAEKKLLPYRKEAQTFKQGLITQYEKYLPQITTLYIQTTHWHGTGRYHYQHQEDSRYEEVCEDKVTDILIAIIESGGLKPHTDPWIDSGDKTVSLATVRMHARAFARIHSCKENILLYELGNVKYWLRLYFLLLLLWLCANFNNHLPFIKSLFRPSFFKDVQTWASALRKSDEKKVVSIFDIFRGNIPVSDIAGNYPILIGTTISTRNLVETIPLTSKVEQRSLQPITLGQFTHIEVPLQYVKETEEILQDRGIKLSVIPMEFGDVYLANQPLEEMAFS